MWQGRDGLTGAREGGREEEEKWKGCFSLTGKECDVKSEGNPQFAWEVESWESGGRVNDYMFKWEGIPRDWVETNT